MSSGAGTSSDPALLASQFSNLLAERDEALTSRLDNLENLVAQVTPLRTKLAEGESNQPVTDSEAGDPSDGLPPSHPVADPPATGSGVGAPISLDLNEVPWLSVHPFTDLIGEGYSVLPHLSLDGKPCLFNLENEYTRRRILEEYARRKNPVPPHRNETLLDYTLIYCMSFYLSCCSAANSQAFEGGGIAACPSDPGRVTIPKSTLMQLAHSAKTTAEVASILRDRLAHIRAKQTEEIDSSTIHILSQVLYEQSYSHLGSDRFANLHAQYRAEFDKQLILQAAKKNAGGAGSNKNPKSNPKKGEPASGGGPKDSKPDPKKGEQPTKS